MPAKRCTKCRQLVLVCACSDRPKAVVKPRRVDVILLESRPTYTYAQLQEALVRGGVIPRLP